MCFRFITRSGLFLYLSHHNFSFLATPVFAYVHIHQQLCPSVNIKQQRFVYLQQQLLLLSTPICRLQYSSLKCSLIATYLSLILYTFLSTASRNHFCQHFRFQPCVSATQQPIPLFVFATFRQQATI